MHARILMYYLSIWPFLNRAGIHASCKHDFGISKLSLDSTYGTDFWYSPRWRMSNRDPDSPILEFAYFVLLYMQQAMIIIARPNLAQIFSNDVLMRKPYNLILRHKYKCEHVWFKVGVKIMLTPGRRLKLDLRNLVWWPLFPFGFQFGSSIYPQLVLWQKT